MSKHKSALLCFLVGASPHKWRWLYLLNNKYRVHEVAKDFKRNSKEIADILTRYATTPKNHMQVLEEDQLNLLFDVITQQHQIDSLETVFASSKNIS